MNKLKIWLGRFCQFQNWCRGDENPQGFLSKCFALAEFRRQLLAIVSASAFFVLSLMGANSAQAITFDYNWKGDTGYSAQGSFSYNETKEFSVITPEELEFLKISFYDQNNKLLKNYIDVDKGVNTGANPYLEFNFDPVTESLFGFFDVGEGTLIGVNDLYLHGTIDSKLELRNLDTNILDSNSGSITVQKIDEL